MTVDSAMFKGRSKGSSSTGVLVWPPQIALEGQHWYIPTPLEGLYSVFSEAVENSTQPLARASSHQAFP